ncbi:response regulator transcription factor [Marinobacter metalliresistant]|uniref:Response regulator transcription factor n=1 Tax=Marinobacter metalliresistant TaxID=2961995 RepID=A0ABZ2W359_9GAMM
MKILVIEDDCTTANYIVNGLRQEGHVVDHLANGRDGLGQAMRADHDMLVVDRMLPGLDGLSLVKTLRAAKFTTPAIFLTTIGGVDDRIEGLKAGGDDYLVKPFVFGELLARIQALARRPATTIRESLLSVDDLTMDVSRRKVTRSDREIDLLPREFALLEHLMRRKGRVQTRTMLLEALWDISFDPQTNVVETHISRLRAKIDQPSERKLIETVRGAGYRIID